MKLPPAQDVATSLIFLLTILSLAAFVALQMHELGKDSARAECRPVPSVVIPKKPISYDTSKTELRRWIRYELAKQRGVL